MGDLSIIFKILGGTLVLLAIINALISFMIKGILEEHGFKVTNMITQPIYEYTTLKKIEKGNDNYILIRKIYLVTNLSFLIVIGLLIILGIIYALT